MGRLRASVEAASAEAAREAAAADAAARAARKGDLAAATLVELERLKVAPLPLLMLQVPHSMMYSHAGGCAVPQGWTDCRCRLQVPPPYTLSPGGLLGL